MKKIVLILITVCGFGFWFLALEAELLDLNNCLKSGLKKEFKIIQKNCSIKLSKYGSPHKRIIIDYFGSKIFVEVDKKECDNYGDVIELSYIPGENIVSSARIVERHKHGIRLVIFLFLLTLIWIIFYDNINKIGRKLLS